MRDASAFLGQWAFAGSLAPSYDQLVARHLELGIDGAAFSPVEAILQPEPMLANGPFLAELAVSKYENFTPVAVPIINPSLPTWEEHLRSLLKGRSLVRAIKVVPTYHDYALVPAVIDALAQRCKEHGLALCVQVRMDDERSHHPRMKVSPLEPASVAALAQRWPGLRVLVCGTYLAELATYQSCANVSVELSFVESGHLLRDALRQLEADRLLLGTHAPLHVPAAGVAKLASDELDATVYARIAEENFNRFFALS